MDAISKILGLHLTVAREQLELMQNGYRINLPADDAGLIPSTEEELILRIGALEGALHRHEQRNAPRS